MARLERVCLLDKQEASCRGAGGEARVWQRAVCACTCGRSQKASGNTWAAGVRGCGGVARASYFASRGLVTGLQGHRLITPRACGWARPPFPHELRFRGVCDVYRSEPEYQNRYSKCQNQDSKTFALKQKKTNNVNKCKF